VRKFQLVKQCYGFDFKIILEWFRQEFSISTPFVNRFHKRQVDVKPKQEPIEVDQELYAAFYQMLSLSETGRQYCRRRGFTDNTIIRSGIRDIQYPDQIFQQLKNIFDVKRIIKSGLARDVAEAVKFTWWHPVLIIPFWNIEGKLSYFQGRHIVQGHNPKYINLSGISKPVYNLQCIGELPKGHEVFLVEGVMDALMMGQDGKIALGVLGSTGFSNEVVQNLLEYKLRIVPDNDKAGEVFAQRITYAFSLFNKKVAVLKLPHGKDFCEYYRKTQKNATSN